MAAISLFNTKMAAVMSCEKRSIANLNQVLV